MKGISNDTLNFICFIADEYDKSVSTGIGSPYLEDGISDSLMMDNLISRLQSDSDRPTSVLTKGDISFLRHAFAIHANDMQTGFGSLWKGNTEEEQSYMDDILGEIQDVVDAHAQRWMEYEGFSGSYQVIPYLSIYSDNDNLYMGMVSYETEFGGLEHFASVTVNIVDLPYLHAAIDTNNNGPQILDFLKKNGFGELTGLQIPNGYCVYPVFKFNEDKLRQIAPAGFAEYAKTHGKQLPTLETQMKDAQTKTQASSQQGRGEAEREL